MFYDWILAGWGAVTKITDSYLRMIVDTYHFICRSRFCQKCYQYHFSGTFRSQKWPYHRKLWFGCSACQKLRFMNTNNISKDGRLYVAACRVIDNFRYEHISKKPQNHVFSKSLLFQMLNMPKKSFWNVFQCFQTSTSLKSQKRAKIFQKMPTLQHMQYGTLFEEDNFPCINLPFFSTFSLSQS